MVQPWAEDAAGLLPAADPFDREKPRGLRRQRLAQVTLDQLEPQIGPGHQPGRGNDVAVVEQRQVSFDLNLRKTLGQ
ncbi:hypothetical protein D3C76_1503970 [compost metagenome]